MLERLHLDRTLFYALLALAGLSLLTVYSASGKTWAIPAATRCGCCSVSA